MTDQLALLGGDPAVTIDQDYYTEWPIYGDEEIEAVTELIRTRQTSGGSEPGGPIYELERAIAERWGVPYALAHPNGTSALHAALFAVGVGPGDEVIVQSATHPYSCVPIIGCGAVPVFADVDPDTLTIDPADVERRITPRTKAVVVVHWDGMPVDMDAILDVAQRHDLKVVEDNCVSQGTLHRGKMCGTLGDAAGISFQVGKLTSAGEGGMFLTSNPEYYQRAAILGHYERLADLPDEQYRAVASFCFGEKYRIATISAAIGVVQMSHWDERFAVRRRNMERLGQAIAEIGGFSPPEVPDYVESPFHRGWVRFDPAELGGIDRAALVEALQAEGVRVGAAGTLRPLHQHPVFAGNAAGTGDLLWDVVRSHAPEERPQYGPGTLPVTEDPEVPYNTITLPALTRPADDLIEQYAQAFRKVAAQAGALAQR